jgi:hypothetical protein
MLFGWLCKLNRKQQPFTRMLLRRQPIRWGGGFWTNWPSLNAIITPNWLSSKSLYAKTAPVSEQTTDPNGQAMFKRLAEEEHANYLILEKAYWSLNNRGVWA